MRKLLIVSPRFPPTNAADIHRVRLSLAHYRRFGWEPTVLCVDPATSDCPVDPMLVEGLPKDIRVMSVRAWSERKCRYFGFGQLGYRSLLPLYFAGSEMLRRQRYDVVFFSSTVFLSFVLGPLWRRRFGCRIVYDWQDPWYSDKALYTRETVPGRWWKYKLDQRLARHFERFAIGSADHVVSVSQGYVEALTRRYTGLDPAKFTILPFAASKEDYEFVRRRATGQQVFQSEPAQMNWIYAGRAGPDMSPVLAALFDRLAALKASDPKFIARLRLHFVGTNYAPAERSTKSVEPVAYAHGLQSAVEEISVRVPYFQIIALYEQSDAILLIGSIHADYTASKLLSCVSSKKPILALFHRQSLVSRIAPEFPNVFLATFDVTPSEPAFHAQISAGVDWLRAPKFDAAAIDSRLERWSAKELTRRQCDIFDRVSVTADTSNAAVPLGSRTNS